MATTALSAEDELLDAAALPVLRSLEGPPEGWEGATEGWEGASPSNANDQAGVHANDAAESDADDRDGLQGGQSYRAPTPSPTYPPTTGVPTAAPTDHPTLRGRVNMLRGIVWYDRNSNGRRDSNVGMEGVGNDVEFSHAVGGVNVQLVQCDPRSGRAYEADGGEALESNAVAITQGFDNRMVPQVIRASDQNGKYNIFINGLERWYYVWVEAPEGFLFTTGICNDEVDDWHCNYDAIVNEAAASPNRRRELLELALATRYPGRALARGGEVGGRGRAPDAPLGIPKGRSTSCVYIDKEGNVERPLNFGVMREGDTKRVNANVALVLDFDGRAAAPAALGGRRLADVVLDPRDKNAIGTVAAEVLAATLDERLSEYGVVLEQVDSKDVFLAGSGGDASAPASQLAVTLEIRGHYSPPPEVDFDFVVQDSINRNKPVIRRGLRDHNDNCREQQVANEQGARAEDYAAVVSARGRQGGGGEAGNVFSTACDAGALVPEYFETELDDVRYSDPTEAAFREAFRSVEYVRAEDAGGRIDDWAMGPVAAIAGMIVLLLGALVFRRALGPRRVDEYSGSRRTLKLDDDEMRRFGEAEDDGSIDSAFYSDQDDDVELEETDRERKIRRKRKEKGDAQRRGGGGPSSSSGGRGSRRNKGLSGRDRTSRRKKEGSGKLAVSQGTNDTDSLGRSSHDSEEAVDKSGRSRDRKRSGRDRTEKKSSKGKRDRDRDASDRRRERRGRNKRRGGDNAKAQEEARIV